MNLKPVPSCPDFAELSTSIEESVLRVRALARTLELMGAELARTSAKPEQTSAAFHEQCNGLFNAADDLQGVSEQLLSEHGAHL